ncbi:hypothetical protein GCM10010464_26780 [Pseudonocardia yunnanensis]|uniref:YCII-related domain-containing protein n=1 Tax=Pseudonocardia yunnanensis TaxID=58107 RepID=A0ABW4F2V1_9PSEU
MSEASPSMPWQDLVTYSETHDLLAKRLFVVFSEPTNGLGPVLENLDPHVAHQTELEKNGIMFGAGPFASGDERHWNGEGMFIYRGSSLNEAQDRRVRPDAQQRSPQLPDPVLAAQRGHLSARLYYSGGKPEIV